MSALSQANSAALLKAIGAAMAFHLQLYSESEVYGVDAHLVPGGWYRVDINAAHFSTTLSYRVESNLVGVSSWVPPRKPRARRAG